MQDIIFYIFIGITVIQLFYYLGVFGKFSFAKSQTTTSKKIPVSVIVCAKNEAEKVTELVPLLAAQNYSDFEIVLIDNASSDGTLDIFEKFEQTYKNIKLVTVENNEAFWGNKKYALTLGIKAASKEYLLFTDADCLPTSKDWIAQMSSQFTLNKTITLGYSSYEKIKNSFLNKIIRFDAVLIATQYFAWAKSGHPYTGNGRNLAYKKEEFFKVNGYIDHMNIRIGEDSLFINQTANKENTAICFTPDSFTQYQAKKTFKSWFKLKRKQDFSSNFFRPFDKLQLKLYNLSQLLFLVLAVTLLALQYNWKVLVPIIVIRYIVAWLTFGYSAAKLEEKDTTYWFPFIEIILIFTRVNVLFTNMFSKPVHWK
ncbi:MAG: glycosyl transferase family 2 [Flavobacterium sp. MedPE-SWcel]|uniref:glycosyltransferase n=1 Tax=uncultured Flavobacterium sp. TaxID=165435 RepID=UPI000921C11D|nr:glycosyltransferase [uncultured Flavobacterium sp.]OIQ16263.1 MAG: glycosyl transferase family 2 [Flavobacterium sp. MedPE-SWcel]